MIEKLRVKQFCCCCTTRTGSLVIGVLGWIGSLLQTIILSTKSEESDSLNPDIDSESNTGTILISILMFGFSVCLVIGVYRDNRKYILPWLIIKFLECCVLTIITLLAFFFLFITTNVGPILIIFIFTVLFTALFWYCWICVWSFYMDLGEIMQTIYPTGQAFPMTETVDYSQYPVDMQVSQKVGENNPPQEMV